MALLVEVSEAGFLFDDGSTIAMPAGVEFKQASVEVEFYNDLKARWKLCRTKEGSYMRRGVGFHTRTTREAVEKGLKFLEE